MLERVVPKEDETVKDEDITKLKKDLEKSINNIYNKLTDITNMKEEKPLIPLANPPKSVANKFFQVVYTPGRRPKLKDAKDFKIMITQCSSKEEALNTAKERITKMNIKWKEKYCMLIPMNPDDIMNEIITNIDDISISKRRIL